MDLIQSLSQFLYCSVLCCYFLFSASMDWEVNLLALCLHPGTARGWDVVEVLSDLYSASSSEYAELTEGFLNGAAQEDGVLQKINSFHAIGIIFH